MIKKLTLTLGSLALLVSFTSMAHADAISFTFLSSATAVHADSTGLTAGPARVLLVSDTNIPTEYGLLGERDGLEGPASSYVAAGNMVTAQYLAGPGTEVEVDSASVR